MASKTIKLTLVRSLSGRIPRHLDTIRGLGLRRMHQTVEREDTPCVRGMVKQVEYLLRIED